MIGPTITEIGIWVSVLSWIWGVDLLEKCGDDVDCRERLHRVVTLPLARGTSWER